VAEAEMHTQGEKKKNQGTAPEPFFRIGSGQPHAQKSMVRGDWKKREKMIQFYEVRLGGGRGEVNRGDNC